jgi:hypothetical protein
MQPFHRPPLLSVIIKGVIGRWPVVLAAMVVLITFAVVTPDGLLTKLDLVATRYAIVFHPVLLPSRDANYRSVLAAPALSSARCSAWQDRGLSCAVTGPLLSLHLR